MKKVILLPLSILLICSAYSFAEVPCKINYQGRLIKDNIPVDGAKTMVFSIYNVATGGSPIWTSGNVSVEVHNGLIRYVLDLSSIDWTAGETLYLQVIVDGETLTPREELSAYPYAINSHLLEGKTTDYFLNASVERQTKDGGLNIMGNLGIGTTSPGARLDVQGGPNNAQGGISLGILNAQSGWVSSPEDLNFVVDNTNRIQDRSFFFRDGTAGNVLMRIQENGNVGIGTAPGSWKLNVAGGDNSFTWAGDHSSSNYIRIGDLQICWGRAFIYGYASGTKSIGFPAAFSETPRVIVNRLTQGAYGNYPDFHIFVKNVNVNLFDLAWYGASSGWVIDSQNYGHYHDWIAIGRWQ